MHKFHIATTGPVSIAYQVTSDFRHYTGGVYSSTLCKNGPMDVNHAVLAVGYGTDPESGLDYWLVKNSWDYTFGLEGYFKIEAYKNMCGVADCMSYPDLYGDGAVHTVTPPPSSPDNDIGRLCSGMACHATLIVTLGSISTSLGVLLMCAGGAAAWRARSKRHAMAGSMSTSLQPVA